MMMAAPSSPTDWASSEALSGGRTYTYTDEPGSPESREAHHYQHQQEARDPDGQENGQQGVLLSTELPTVEVSGVHDDRTEVSSSYSAVLCVHLTPSCTVEQGWGTCVSRAVETVLSDLKWPLK